jgi:hypothetical protein
VQTDVAVLDLAGYVVNGTRAAPDLRGVTLADPGVITAIIHAEEAVAAIDAARARGARVLFVRIGGPGGHCEGSFNVYDALRRFAAGGLVVTFALPGRVASSATVLHLAGDLRLMDPSAEFLLHSVVGTNGAALSDTTVAGAWNRRLLDVYTTRTSTPRDALEEAVRCTFTPDGTLEVRTLDVHAALAFGWAAFPADEATARQMAEHLARQMAGPAPRIAVTREVRDVTEVPTASITAAKIAAGAISAEKIGAGTITTRMLVSAYGDNLWPNGMSEISPPSGYTPPADDPEFGHRVYGGAAAGYYCRKFEAKSGEADQMFHTVPAQEGDRYYFAARVKLISGATNPRVILSVYGIDADGVPEAAGVVTVDSPVGSWVSASTGGIALPAATVAVMFGIQALQDGGTTVETARVDSIQAYRMTPTALLATGAVTLDKLAPRFHRATVDVTAGSPGSVALVGNASGISGVSLVTPSGPGVPCVRFTLATAMPDTDYVPTVVMEYPTFGRSPAIVEKTTTYFTVGWWLQSVGWSSVDGAISHRFSVLVHR